MNRKTIIRNLRSKGIAFDENASTSDLNALLIGAQNRISKSFNYAGGRGKIQVTFNAADESPVQILINEDIGKDPWSGEGISEKEIRDTLSGITPNTRQLDFLTNSAGGYVHTGTAMRNLLDQWPGKITNTIIGVAASTASWCIPADTTKAYKNSQIFTHRAMAAPFGNVDDLQDAIDFLNKTDRQIADMYAEQTGKSCDEMLDMMRGTNGQGTLMTGKEALEIGLVDELIDGDAKNQFSTEQLNAMKQKLAALNSIRFSGGKEGTPTSTAPSPANTANRTGAPQPNPPATPPETNSDASPAPGNPTNTNQTIMNKEKMIALLNKWGVTVPANATDADLEALIAAGKPAPAPTNAQPAPAALNAEDRATLDALRNQVAANRRKEIQTAVQNAATECRIPVLEIENWINDAVAAVDHPTNGNPVLARLNKLEPRVPGITPIPQNLEITGESFADVQKFVVANSSGFIKNFLGQKAQNEITPAALREISTRAKAASNALHKHRNQIIAAWNSNSIDAALQRALILQDMLEEYAKNLLPLEAFSVKYESVPLQGTDQVVVPYFPLQATASTQFVKGTGYTTKSDWTENSRTVTVGGDGAAASSGANATAGTAKDRLYQAIDFASYDMARQPYLNVTKLAQQAANKLAVDIFTQIVSRVVVVGNFGAAVKTVAPALFTPDDIADLAEIATSAEWPDLARSLVLTNTYKTPLLKDTTFKNALSYGSTDPIRKAMIQEAYGFQDMYFVANLAAKLATNTSGWINHKSAVLCAFAPIMPTPEVRNLLTAYDIAVDPRAGCVLEYRKFGDATKDQTTEVIESSFGAAKGVDGALKIVKSQ